MPRFAVPLVTPVLLLVALLVACPGPTGSGGAVEASPPAAETPRAATPSEPTPASPGAPPEAPEASPSEPAAPSSAPPGTPAPPPAPAGTPAAPQSPTPTPDGAAARPADVAGAWSSPSCGARTYERRVTFRGATYSGEDRVSPCPRGVTCVWSGIVTFSGTWAIDGASIVLTEARADPAGVAAQNPRPATLLWDGGLVEAAGEARCSYTRR